YGAIDESSITIEAEEDINTAMLEGLIPGVSGDGAPNLDNTQV
ncbi:phage major capsid protein, P2 family, partial [Yersinia enterocolitica]|nr:phage major capsid protein, P2 family [Yersinia enterocolitica]